MNNPLLQAQGLPDFSALQPAHVAPALDVLLADAHAALARAGGDAVAADYDTLSALLEVPVERLRRAWGAVAHLHAVADTPPWRAAYADNLARVTDLLTRLGADAGRHAKTREIAASAPVMAALGPVRRKVVADALRDFVLEGAELQGPARERFAQIRERSAELCQQFGERVMDATDGWFIDVQEAQLDGLPDDVREAAREAARAAGVPGFRLGLQEPMLWPVLRHAHDRELRRALFTAQTTLCSELGDPALDNSATIDELLALRREEAALLGQPSYAHLSLVPKMAESPAQVMSFLHDLAQRARPAAEAQAQALREFASEELGLAELQPWDRRYAAERLRERRYEVSEQALRLYFPLPRVLDGLMRLLGSLFDVTLRPAPATPLWHADAAAYEVERAGQPIGLLALDLLARSGKQPGAWMDNLVDRWQRPDDGRLQQPVAAVVCNFSPAVGARPPLLSHGDVLTLFHEFGHALHQVLTRVDELAVSGIGGVEWDAVELPSQFMENFAWQWPVLEGLSGHVDDGTPLPRTLFDRLLSTRRFQSGLRLMHSVEYALFDLHLHLGSEGAQDVHSAMALARREAAVWPPAAFERYPHSFGHLFDGSYAAGFYGYDWADVLSADAFAAFEEAGVFDPATGRRFRETVLEVGGSRPMLESFRAFRGRAPQVDALLQQYGLLAADAASV